MRKKYTLGFSLTELIIVVIIVGILAGIGIPAYRKFVNTSQDKQARAVLRTLGAAEKVYYQKNGFYYPPPPDTFRTDIDIINSGLGTKLLPDRNTHPDKPWDYVIEKTAGGFIIKAVHKSGREIRINQDGKFSEI